MSKENNTDSTLSDDSVFDAGQDYQNLDDIPVPMGAMAEALGLTGESLPDDDDDVLDPEDSVDEDEVPEPEDTTDEDDTVSDDEPDEEEDEDEDESEDSTQDDELPSEDEIDWEYKVPVKIDGEIQYKTIEDLRKGFATDQHLSKKGRENSELKKELEEVYTSKLGELSQLSQVLDAQLSMKAGEYAKEYHEIEKQIKEARDNGNTYDLGDLKDKRDVAQENYWKADKEKQVLNAEVQKRQKAQMQEYQKTILETFDKDIQEFIPDYNTEYADSIRAFAKEEGIPEDIFNTVADARVVKFVDEYRKLKTAAKKGSAKRKETPKVKKVPTRKTPKASQAKRKSQAARNTVLSGQGNERDEMDFLKSISKFR